MSDLLEDSNALSNHLSGPIEVGPPDVAGPLTVYPLIGPATTLDYVAFATAHGKVAITELEGGASVNDLVVQNQGDKPVLLYEGEELLGAQQNRVLDISILVAANSKTKIPVSCVEQGRWDGGRHRERFTPSTQTADPRMRKLKNQRARVNAAAGLAARADQGEVWNEVSVRSAEMQASSPTGAMSDIFEGHRERLSNLREKVSLHDGQCGSVAVIGGKITVLDFVGRADVFAALQPAIIEGYALDALAHERAAADGELREPLTAETVRGFTLLVCDAPGNLTADGPGIGQTARFAANGVEGSALIADGEMVQMTAFPSDDDAANEATRRAHRVRRPSRRRGQ